MKGRIVIIGVGNLLMGDDGIGIHTALALMKEELPGNVEVFDAATRAFDVLEYMDGAEKAVLVDAIRNNGEPSSIYRFRFDPGKVIQDEAFNLSMHDINFLDALKAGREIYDLPSEIVIIGVEPQTLECGMGLSSRLNSMLPVIIDSVKSELDR